MDPILFQINQKPKSKGKPGLPKTPIDLALVTKNGLKDDFNNFRNLKKNNDPDMALMILSCDIINDLNTEGWTVKPGDLGENLTFSNIDYSEFSPSQQYKVGEIEMEISFICDPCLTLKHLPYIGNARVKDFIKTLVGRRGWYAKVLKPGKIKKGDLLTRI
tara:strand:- start:311 stop:793 length:483 start_codon:yes stop_codon:yes gene_type:complete